MKICKKPKTRIITRMELIMEFRMVMIPKKTKKTVMS